MSSQRIRRIRRKAPQKEHGDRLWREYRFGEHDKSFIRVYKGEAFVCSPDCSITRRTANRLGSLINIVRVQALVSGPSLFHVLAEKTFDLGSTDDILVVQLFCL